MYIDNHKKGRVSFILVIEEENMLSTNVYEGGI